MLLAVPGQPVQVMTGCTEGSTNNATWRREGTLTKLENSSSSGHPQFTDLQLYGEIKLYDSFTSTQSLLIEYIFREQTDTRDNINLWYKNELCVSLYCDTSIMFTFKAVYFPRGGIAIPQANDPERWSNANTTLRHIGKYMFGILATRRT